MDWAAIGSGVSGVANSVLGALNSHWDRKAARENVQKTIDANKELAQYSYEQEMAQLEYMNEYNTPANQKARLEEAGLNPALMYESSPQNVQTKTAEYKAPDVDYRGIPAFNIPKIGMENLNAYMDYRIKTEQADNLEAQRRNIEKDTLLKAANVIIANTTGERSKFELELVDELRKYTLEGAKLANEKQEAEIGSLNSKTAVNKVDKALKQAELKLRQRGIYPGDPMYMRALIQMFAGNKGFQNWMNMQIDGIGKPSQMNELNLKRK
jgi:hypothetical protein